MLRQVLFLVKEGVPWSDVMAMSETRRLACCVALGELNGQVFDWTSFSWSAIG